jgi:hypothetical protein
MDEELRWRITAFFDYWRERYKFICDLDFEKHNHEANVLLWASLDALSNLWVKNIGRNHCSHKVKRLIFDAFLAHYGGDLFQIVSLPDVWSRVDRETKLEKTKQKLPEDLYILLHKIGERRIPEPDIYDADLWRIRQISDDWRLDKIITVALNDSPQTNCTELEQWLVLSRYGAIAYKEMRSTYIHEGRSGKGAHGFSLSRSAISPTYSTGIYSTPPTIGFNVKFMLSVLESCINAFEKDALAMQQDPVPEE